MINKTEKKYIKPYPYVAKEYVATDDMIIEIEKFIERLKGYGCGYHKQLEKQMLNIIKGLRCQK